MARDPFILPADLHVYPASFRVRPLDFELGPIWPRLIDRRPWSDAQDATPFTVDGLPGFGTLWLDWLGGPRDAPRFIRRVFERREGDETQYEIDSLRVGRPLLRLSGPDPTAIWRKRTVRAAVASDRDEQRLALVAMLLLTGTERNADKGAAIRLALNVGNLTARRDEAMRQGALLGMLERDGVSGERALKRVAAITRSSVGTVRANRSRSQVRAIMAAFAKGGTLVADQLPHPADDWFAAGQERDVAIGLAYRMGECTRDGDPPDEALRWSLLILAEGYWRRRRPLPAEVLSALASCLGVLDRDGRPRRTLSLAGVRLRGGFMEFAASAAWDEFEDYYYRAIPADAATEEDWLAHPFHILAVEAIRARLRAKPVAA
jgi:hypothetical protein